MRQYVVLALTALLASLAIYNSQSETNNLAVESPSLDYFNIHAAECTKTLELECAVDIERTVVACAKAFETGGVDVIADIKCAKDLLSDKKHCWPCICAEAKKKHWHIIGC